MSKKYDDFIAALGKLQAEHDIQLYTESPAGLRLIDLKTHQEIYEDEFNQHPSKKISKLAILKKLDDKLLELGEFCEHHKIPMVMEINTSIFGHGVVEIFIDHRAVFKDQS